MVRGKHGIGLVWLLYSIVCCVVFILLLVAVMRRMINVGDWQKWWRMAYFPMGKKETFSGLSPHRTHGLISLTGKFKLSGAKNESLY